MTTPPFPTAEATTIVTPSAAAAVAAEMPTLQGYELFAELGRGGMGVVYKARQVALQRLVAVKMILAAQHAGADDLARFHTEAEAVAQLQHPNIVQIHEIGTQDGRPYFCLEFVEGGTLAQKIKADRPGPRAAAECVATLARAVHFAHQRHIVHRDLKPGNILLTPDGQPKITDFGLAKRLDAVGSQTQTGSVLGTPNYMAPEQASGHGKEIGPATDVYALGAILYEMLTGQPPFHAESAFDTILQVLEQQPPRPRHFNRSIDASLEAICLKCLEKSPRDRYPTAQALADDLGAYLRGEPVLADANTVVRVMHLLLRESRHTEVLSRWGKVWIWHAAITFLLFFTTNVLLWSGVEQGWPYALLWAVGFLGLGAVVWHFRFRNHLPLTPIEWQLGQAWGVWQIFRERLR